MKMPSLSIITVNYNSGAGLENTVDSILPIKNLLDAECILVDGLSTDDSLSRLGDKANIFSVISSEPDLGIYDAMNKGVKFSKGNWIWFLNSGDLALNSARSIGPFLATSIQEVNFLYGDFVTSSGVVVTQELGMKLLFSGMLNHQTIIYSKNLLIQPFDLSYGLAADFAHLLMQYKKILPQRIDAPLVQYDLFGQSSKFTRSSRIKTWYQRFRSFKNSDLSLSQKLFGMIISLSGCIIKAFFPKIYSRTLKLQSRGL